MTTTAQVMNRGLPNIIHVNFQIRDDYVISFLQLGWGSCLKKKVTVDGAHFFSDKFLEPTFTKTAVSLV
jgi:hypothetical protein